MTKKDARERKIRNNVSNVSLVEFEALINRYGEIIVGGSHPKAHINKHYFPYKRHNPVDGHYVRGILRLIDEMEG